jgi:Asp-tRNA(Asn)/Glu-tRNA(Gln) amidotransferase A subunit family amidase
MPADAAATARLSATAAARAIAAGDLDSVTLVEACLQRIAEREPTVSAWKHLDPDAALAQARQRDSAPAPGRGPLHGVPVAVKDIIDTADMPTSYGTTIHAGHRPAGDAVCVARLRAAGAVILGKTHTTELAMWTPAPTANPLDPTRTPGGSSSGSAAAVADAMAPVALGSQTAGSTIRPASFCGVLGFKPTHGLLDTGGVLRLSARLDTLGLFARDAGDLEPLAHVLAGREVGDGDDRPPALALARTPWWDRADDDGRRALLRAGERLADAGARVTEVELPASFAALPDAHDAIMAFDAARALTFEREHAEALSERVRDYLDRGAGTDPAEVDAALALGERCGRELERLLEGHDALLVPAVPGQAPRGLEATGDPLFCRAWTLLHTPAVSVPGMAGDDGLPIGVQLVALPGADAALLAAARWAAAALA